MPLLCETRRVMHSLSRVRARALAASPDTAKPARRQATVTARRLAGPCNTHCPWPRTAAAGRLSGVLAMLLWTLVARSDWPGTLLVQRAAATLTSDARRRRPPASRPRPSAAGCAARAARHTPTQHSHAACSRWAGSFRARPRAATQSAGCWTRSLRSIKPPARGLPALIAARSPSPRRSPTAACSPARSTANEHGPARAQSRPRAGPVVLNQRDANVLISNVAQQSPTSAIPVATAVRCTSRCPSGWRHPCES